MAPRSWLLRAALAVLPVVVVGCFDEPPLGSGAVFDDGFATAVGYEPFLNSKLDAVSLDTGQRYAGSASLRFSVPAPGDPGAGLFGFSGGAVTSGIPQDLSGFTALTFWAKASRAVAFDSFGLANDNTGTSRYQTEWQGVPITTEWSRFVVPIPAPGKLTQERGMFWLAAGDPVAYQVWFDEIRFEALDPTGWNPRPALVAATRALGVGDTYQVSGTAVTYGIDGRELTMGVFPATFDYASSAPAVATVDEGGLVTAHASGSAVVSASLAGVAAPQTVTINVGAGLSPLAGPPTPTVPAADVISIYSDAYTDVAIDKMAADWSNACTNPICPRWSEVTLGGDTVSKYAELLFTAIEFTGTHVVDATAFTRVHVDVWVKDAAFFKVKLVDFGANGVFAGGDDKEHELTFNAGSSPALLTGQWVSIDVPFTAFTGLTTRAHLAQFVMSAPPATVFIDNVYFHR
ncbi:MAG: Ig-like domain-containing protein [Anaeromyxobacter sp.]|nr:Ig-like domain-containing protein [Anaeromyxobacter sp.]